MAVAVAVVTAVLVTLVSGQGLIQRSCLDCLCEASSGCDMNTGCTNNGVGEYYCGPYHISFFYWQDAGSPEANPSNPRDFEECLVKKDCAEATVTGYMQRWAHDCDNDGLITCYDLARIHKAGPFGCNGTWVLITEFWDTFTNCYRF